MSIPVVDVTPQSEEVLRVENLKVSFRTERGVVQAVDDVSFSVRSGEVLAIVGESGSGKSVSAMTLMGLTRSPNATISGTARLADGTELVTAPDEEMQRVRGSRLAMIFQDPMSALTRCIASVTRSSSRSGRTRRSPSRPPARAPSNCWNASASRTQRNGRGPTRTSSPAACGSA